MSWPVLPHGFLGSQVTGDNDTYQISRSLRFNSADSAYLNRTPASAGNRKTWTWSGWVKRGVGANWPIFSAVSDVNNATLLRNFGDVLDFSHYISSSFNGRLTTTSVFRDYSAWYHIVAVFDTPNATAGNRMRLYVNGSELTAFSADTAPTQNSDGIFNSTSAHYLGVDIGFNNQYMNGYLAEINFIDGQALTPSSFGETDAITGRWKAKAYTGDYGVNGFYLPFSNNSGATATTLGKDNSTYRMLTAQLNGTSNGIQRGADLTGIANGKSGTVSMWWNFTGASSGLQPLWTSRNNSTIGTTLAVNRTATGTILVAALNSSGTTILYAETNSTVAASSGVYHIYATWDLAVNNQVKIYVNGVDQALTITTFTNATIQYSVPNHGLGGHLYSPFSPTTPGMVGQVYVNYSTYLDPTTNIGKFYGGANTPVSLGSSGEIPTGSSPIVYLDGDATSILTNRGTGGNFAAYGTLSTGTTYSGTGVHYNNWTPNNFSVTAGAGNDSLVDSPTNYGTDTGVGGEVRGNYATLNPLISGNIISPIDGNLNISLASGVNSYFSTVSSILISSGKWYWEQSITQRDSGAGDWFQFGIVSSNTTYTNHPIGMSGNMSNAYAYYNTGAKASNGTYTSFYGASFTTNDVVGVAFDADNGTITFYKNGVSQGQAFSGITGSTGWLPIIQVYRSTSVTQTAWANFGQRPFAYTAPAGFRSLCTTNLPTPTIQKPSSYMDVVTYTGNNSARSITGLNFSPDLVWIKSRSASTWNFLFDAVRGATKWLASNQTGAEATNTTSLTSFDSGGFSLSTDPAPDTSTGWNANSATYVAWAWDAGETSSTNTAGSITSTVRANPVNGVSIVSFSGPATSALTVGHGLNAAPKMILLKNRDQGSAGYRWCVYHSSIGNTKALFLDGTNDAGTPSSGYWNNTSPTSSVFSVWNAIITGTEKMIAYCFAEVEGFSKFGSYTGTGTTDGAFVWCGFRPRYILFKCSSTTDNWYIRDTTRDTYNLGLNYLQANVANAEATSGGDLDYLSNGFKCRNSLGLNASGQTYIFAAFAESPFKYARAR